MEYTVKRSARKTLCLKFDREGKLVVFAPDHYPSEKISEFVARHRQWIARHEGAYRATVPLADGETLSLCGKNYTICTAERTARIKGEFVFLPAEGRKEALFSLCKKLTKARMKEFTDRIALCYGFSYTRLGVTAARSRWGSCSAKGHINYSLYGAFLPDALAEYLAVHELCHTRHLDHSAAFWNEVRKILPDYAKRRGELKKYQYVFRI